MSLFLVAFVMVTSGFACIMPLGRETMAVIGNAFGTRDRAAGITDSRTRSKGAGGSLQVTVGTCWM